MVVRHTPQQIQDYYDNPSINQSALKVILKVGVQAFINQGQEAIHTDEIYFEDKEHFLIGKGVDCLITEGEEIFDTAYFYSKLQKKPSEKPMAIVKKVFEEMIEERRSTVLVNHRRELYDAMNTIVGLDGKVGYYLNNKIPSEKLIKGEPDTRTWEDDRRYINMLSDGTCQAYWEELITANGKKVLTEDQYTLIRTMTDSFLNHKFTKTIFDESGYQEHRDIIYQLPLFWSAPVAIKVNGQTHIGAQNCKCLIDGVIIDHKKRKISPFDIKTTGLPIMQFNRQIEHRRYDIQAAYYLSGLTFCRGIISNIVGRDVSNYDVPSFAFIAQSTLYPGVPVVFPVSAELAKVGGMGNGDDKRGFVDAMMEYKEYEAYNFDLTEALDRHHGVMWIDGDFKLV